MPVCMCATACRELQDKLAKTDQQMQRLQSWSLTQLVSCRLHHSLSNTVSFLLLPSLEGCVKGCCGKGEGESESLPTEDQGGFGDPVSLEALHQTKETQASR